MGKEKQNEEIKELTDLLGDIGSDWNNYIDECQENEQEPQISYYDFYAQSLIEQGYRKERQGEWIKKHRHRGGFRTVTITDSFGEKHTGTIDNRYEYDELYCSVCGKIAHDAFLNYCANCGAKMRGTE